MSNKSNRNLNLDFDLKQFNTKFKANEEQLQKNRKNVVISNEIISTKLPHQKPVEDILINIREMFYKVIEMLSDEQNPLPYLFSTPDRQFALSIFLIIIGSCLLLFSNLMISSDEK